MKIFLFAILLCIFNTAFAQKIKNKTIFLTAATSELGQAIAFSLASQGYDLILTGRNPTKVDNLSNKLKFAYKTLSVKTAIIDFSNFNTVEKAAQKFSHCAIEGIVLIGPRPEFSSTFPSRAEWNKNFSETFVCPLEVVRSFESRLKEDSSIVIISGNTSKTYIPNYPNTNVLRLAWSGEVKNLAHFLKNRKIRVNAISPGPILTEYHKTKIQAEALKNNTTFEATLAKKVEFIPRGSYGSPEDVANLVSFLISDKSKHLNASNILLDGGGTNTY